jgi:hypothetical protein
LPDEQQAPVACPACRGRLYPKLLKCTDCGAEVTTRYAGNEFADLAPEDLHLLRIFVHCEGSIREMESALGVSYPTVKSRLAALRDRLGLAVTAEPAARAEPQGERATAREILDRLADGTLTYDEALPKIRALRGRS